MLSWRYQARGLRGQRNRGAAAAALRQFRGHLVHLGMKNQVGSLEPGQKADLFMINLRRAHLVPSLRVVSAFVHNGQPADIEDVMVDGQWLMREGKVLTISEGDLIRQAEQIGHDVWQRLVQQFPSISLPFSLPPEPLSWACG